MDQCAGRTSDGILVRNYGEYNKSATLWIVTRSGRKKIYEQQDKLALQYCQDLDGKGAINAGLGFPVISRDMTASLNRQHTQRGATSAFVRQVMSKPIGVESFCINDSIFVFDNIANLMFIFNQSGEQLESNHIDFNNRDFMNKYIIDDQTKLTYGVFRNKKGIYLQLIDRKTGKSLGSAKWIDMHFFEKVRICQNMAIYLKYDHPDNHRSLTRTYLENGL